MIRYLFSRVTPLVHIATHTVTTFIKQVGGLPYRHRLLFGSLWLSCSALNASAATPQTLTIESWFGDTEVWETILIPAFNRHHPEITIKYTGDYHLHRTLPERLAQGKGSDLFTCRPFDDSLSLFKQGHLVEITELPGIESFPSFAQSPWQTDSGAQTFCLPMASVIHGFFYNKAIFRELGVTPPQDEAEFFSALKRAKQGGYVPLAIGTNSQWAITTMGFQNVGPNYWQGEDGRIAVLEGEAALDSQAYQALFTHLAKWKDYLVSDYSELDYSEANELFGSGKAAVYPAGSWTIADFNDRIELGAFRPPVAQKGDACYFSEHTDIGMGINAHSPNQAAAKTFLKWMSTAEFAKLFTNNVPGFFSLSNHFFEVENEVARTMMNWRNECDSTIRSHAQRLSRGEPNLDQLATTNTLAVLSGELTPKQAASQLQQGLASWYPPQQALLERRKQQQQLMQCAPPIDTRSATAAAANTTSEPLGKTDNQLASVPNT